MEGVQGFLVHMSVLYIRCPESGALQGYLAHKKPPSSLGSAVVKFTEHGCQKTFVSALNNDLRLLGHVSTFNGNLVRVSVRLMNSGIRGEQVPCSNTRGLTGGASAALDAHQIARSQMS